MRLAAYRRYPLEAAVGNAARKVTTPAISSAKEILIGVVRNIDIARVNRGGVVDAGENDDVGLVVPGACEQVGGLFTSVVGETKIRVPIAGVNLQPTIAVNQKHVHHAGNRLGAVDRRCTIFQNVDVINQTQWKPVEVD